MFSSYFSGIPALVKKATSDDPNPTPGFVLNDLNKATLESVESSNEVFNQLMYRLTKFNSANVKAKSLRCMRSIARGGNPVFKVKLIEAKEEIRKCLSYKAPHDPIRGEELTALVHTETQELLNSLYETADEQNPMAHSAHFSSMEGGKEDPQPQQGAGVFGTVYNAGAAVFSAVGSGLSSGYSYITGRQQQPQKGDGNDEENFSSQASSAAPNPYAEIAPSEEFEAQEPQKAAPEQEVAMPHQEVPAPEISAFGPGTGGQLVGVLMMTADRPTVPGSVLSQFTSGVKETGTVREAMDALLAALSNQNWKIKLRALVGVESLSLLPELKASVTAAVVANPEPVRACAASPQQTVRTRAQKLLSFIGVPERAPAPQPAVAVAPQPTVLETPAAVEPKPEPKPTVSEESLMSSAFAMIIKESKQEPPAATSPAAIPSADTQPAATSAQLPAPTAVNAAAPQAPQPVLLPQQQAAAAALPQQQAAAISPQVPAVQKSSDEVLADLLKSTTLTSRQPIGGFMGTNQNMFGMSQMGMSQMNMMGMNQNLNQMNMFGTSQGMISMNQNVMGMSQIGVMNPNQNLMGMSQLGMSQPMMGMSQNMLSGSQAQSGMGTSTSFAFLNTPPVAVAPMNMPAQPAMMPQTTVVQPTPPKQEPKPDPFASLKFSF